MTDSESLARAIVALFENNNGQPVTQEEIAEVLRIELNAAAKNERNRCITTLQERKQEVLGADHSYLGCHADTMRSLAKKEALFLDHAIKLLSDSVSKSVLENSEAALRIARDALKQIVGAELDNQSTLNLVSVALAVHQSQKDQIKKLNEQLKNVNR